MQSYEKILHKIPQETPDYPNCSEYVVSAVESIVQEAILSQRNQIIINTNLRLGLPMENINKIAGPFVEAWAVEIFSQVLEDPANKYHLIHVEAQERLDMADLILQFKKKRKTYRLGILPIARQKISCILQAVSRTVVCPCSKVSMDQK